MSRREGKRECYSYGSLEKNSPVAFPTVGLVNNTHAKFTCGKRMPVIIFCFRVTNLVH